MGMGQLVIILFQDEKKSTLKNVLKRFSRHEETKSLLGEETDQSLNKNYYLERTRDQADDDKVSPGCIGTSLLYIFLKIFD